MEFILLIVLVASMLFLGLFRRVANWNRFPVIDKILLWLFWGVLIAMCIRYFLLPFVIPELHGERGMIGKALFRNTATALVAVLLSFLLHKKQESPANDLENVRHELRKAYTHPRFIFHRLRHGGIFRTRSDLEKDLSDILSFDELVRAGEDVMFPKMRTPKGRKLWDRYIKAYVLERNAKAQGRGLRQERHESALLSAGGWICTCGRVNPSYTTTCVCGTHMRQIPPSDRRPAPQPIPAPGPTSWLCACGRENPNYTYTCVCGKNKRDSISKEVP